MDGLQQFSIVVFILASLGGALWALKRRGIASFSTLLVRPRAGRKLEVLERLQLTPQHSVCLIRFEDRTLLIGTAPASCRVLEGSE